MYTRREQVDIVNRSPSVPGQRLTDTRFLASHEGKDFMNEPPTTSVRALPPPTSSSLTTALAIYDRKKRRSLGCARETSRVLSLTGLAACSHDQLRAVSPFFDAARCCRHRVNGYTARSAPAKL